MPYALFVDSSNSVSFNPEFDFTRRDNKIEDVHRVRSGEQYRYKWGEFARFSMTVKYLNSADMSIINSWWSTNTDLLFMEEGTTDVYSVHIANKDTPIGKQALPYDNQFYGKLELETY